MIVSLASEQDKRLALSLWAVNLPLGAAIGMLLTPALAAVGGWRLAWLAGMALQLLALLLPLACKPVFQQRNVQPPPSTPQQAAICRATPVGGLALWPRFHAVYADAVGGVCLAADHAAWPAGTERQPYRAAVGSRRGGQYPRQPCRCLVAAPGMARDTLICSALGLMGLSGLLAFWPGLSPDAAYLLCLLLSFCGGAAASRPVVSPWAEPWPGAAGGFARLLCATGQSRPIARPVDWPMVAGSADWSVARSLFLAGAVLAAMLFAMRPRSH
jgi:hypothetical protein